MSMDNEERFALAARITELERELERVRACNRQGDALVALLQSQLEARRTVSGQEADEVLEFAIALEKERALHIVRAVREQGFAKSKSAIPTQAESVFDLACEEIEHRLRTEVWELGGVAAPIPATEQETK